MNRVQRTRFFLMIQDFVSSVSAVSALVQKQPEDMRFHLKKMEPEYM